MIEKNELRNGKVDRICYKSAYLKELNPESYQSIFLHFPGHIHLYRY